MILCGIDVSYFVVYKGINLEVIGTHHHWTSNCKL